MSADGVPLASLDGSPAILQAGDLARLAAGVDGSVLRAGDPGWDEAVQLWNGMVAGCPALMAQPATAAGVAAAVRFAAEHRLLLGVKGGGHNIAGTGLAPGGLTLDMSRMRQVTVDPAAMRAHAGAGCLLRDVDTATQAHGLATPLGFISGVGIAGLTLGGGLGYLTRRFGWTVDNLDEVEIVTADGEVRTAGRTQHDDLFWGLRGAGANLGVVTRFTYRLHRVGPSVHGGLVAWPFARADEVLRAYRAVTAAAPRELTVFVLIFRAPPAPFIPPRWHGERICAMVVCYSGEPARADEILAPIRALGEPITDLIGPQPYTQIQSYLDGAEPKGAHYYWKTGYLPELSDEFLMTMRELAARSPLPGGDIGLLHIGGALNEHDPDDGAVGNRDARYVFGANGMWQPGDPGADGYRDWIRAAWAQIRPFSTGGNYINFQTADEDGERIRATYGANFDRLVAVKQKYDPGNLFRVNRNIASAAGQAVQ
jgi:FAD/FMN-containing dehydrogenase